MQKSRQHLYRKSASIPAYLSRRDFISAQLVEIGIVIQCIQGTPAAAEYLRSKKVDVDVALRVLSEPSKRRTWSSLNNENTLSHSMP